MRPGVPFLTHVKVCYCLHRFVLFCLFVCQKLFFSFPAIVIPTTTTAPTSAPTRPSSDTLAMIPDIVGPIVGVLCLLALLIILAIFLRKRKLEKGLEAFSLNDMESRSVDSRRTGSTLAIPGVRLRLLFFSFSFSSF